MCTQKSNVAPPSPPFLQGLEDQLLGDVVRHERPELEEALGRLVQGLAADRRQLAELEDKVGRGAIYYYLLLLFIIIISPVPVREVAGWLAGWHAAPCWVRGLALVIGRR
jgi:hypothetical protein